MNSDRNPKVYIIAGPNGAGKTTFATKFLPKYVECMEFVNADLIASALSPFVPDRAAFRAGRLMLEQIHLLADRGIDFGFETTLAGKGYVRLLHNLKGRGYSIHLFYLWVRSIDIALERIADRVRRGGHNVPEDVVADVSTEVYPTYSGYIVRYWIRGLSLTIQLLLQIWLLVKNPVC